MKNMKEIKKLRKVTYKKMADLFREKERNGQTITGYITKSESYRVLTF